mmetsp:Transcript_16424/g.38976  ORF Transcript_16424/g.38976 Transcript_16424/m.38976 type:complete len:260 (-) Transcript_16424:151-930(-)
MLQVLLRLAFICLHEQFLELLPCSDPYNGISSGSYRRCSRRKIQQRQLPEAATSLHSAERSRCHLLGTGGGILFLRNFEAPGLDHVEVVCLQVVLFDDGLALGNLLFPHDVDHGGNLVIIEIGDGVEVGVLLQSRRDQLLFVRSLGARGLNLSIRHLAPTHSSSFAKLQLRVKLQPCEGVPRDSQRLDLAPGLDGRCPRLIPEQSILPEVVSGLEGGHSQSVHLHSCCASLEDEKLMALVTLLYDLGALGIRHLLCCSG